MKELEGKFYTIEARHSGRVIDIRNGDTNDGARMQQHDNSGSNAQQFALFSFGDSWVIVARHSGKVVDAQPPESPSLDVHQWGFYGTPHQQFKLAPVQTEGGNRYFSIQVKDTDRYLDIDCGSAGNYAGVKKLSSHKGFSQQFKLNEVSRMHLPEIRTGQIEPTKSTAIPVNLRIKSFDELPPEYSDSVLVGEVFLPFFLVSDPAHPANWQIENNPYYKLSREQFWKRIHYKQWNGARKVSSEIKIFVGMTQTARKEVEECLGVSVSSDFSFKYLGATIGIKSEIESKLKVSTSYSEEAVEEKTITRTVEYSPGPPFCEAFWVLVDRYTLSRACDSEPFREWQIIREDTLLEDIHPCPRRLTTSTADRHAQTSIQKEEG